MSKGSLNVSLKGADDIFSTEESRQEQQREQVQQIPIGELFPFKDHPFKVLDAMEQEQNSNKTRLSELNLLLHQSDEQESDVHAFIEEIRKYAAIKELDEVVLNRLIKKIMIGEVQKVDGQKIQEVKIIYNFVGEISA